MAAAIGTLCYDFLEFKDALQKMRKLDDNIVYALNSSIPTESFKGQVDATKMCKDLYEQLSSNYTNRENAIKGCIMITAERIEGLRKEREADHNRVEVITTLRKEQTHLRLLQGELGIEEVMKNRTDKIYYERCRPYYKPPSAATINLN